MITTRGIMRALRVVSRFRHRVLLRHSAVLNAAGRRESPGSTLILNAGESLCQMSGFSISDTDETRPATSSRPVRKASPRSSSPGAGWRRMGAALRRFSDRYPLDWSDIAGLCALFLMIWPFIL